MRVVFIIRDFLLYTSELANALARAGIEVVVITSDSNTDFVGTGTEDIRTEYRDLLDSSVQLEWVSVPDDTNPATLYGNFRSIVQMVRLARRYRPDIVHLMDTADYRTLIVAAAARLQCPVVLTIHDAELHPGDYTNKMEFMRPWLRSMSEAVIVHGEYIKHRLLTVSKISERRISCIPHGPYTMYRQWKSPDVTTDGKTILFFGRINKYKGLEYLIKAAPIVCKQIPDARFVVAGSGPDLLRCKELIENPEKFVLRDERVSNIDVTRLFEEASVVALPYIEASQSGVLAIAFALGKPAIVTNVGSLPEVVCDGETGVVIPPGSAETLAEAIIRLLQNPESREAMAAKAFERAETGDLSWDFAASKTSEVYNALIKRRWRKK